MDFYGNEQQKAELVLASPKNGIQANTLEIWKPFHSHKNIYNLLLENYKREY